MAKGEEQDPEVKMFWNIVGGVFAVILVIMLFTVVFGSFYIIGAGQRGVLLTWGSASDITVTEGLHMKWPIAQKVVKMNIQTQKYEADASAASKDLQVVHTKIAVNYHLSSDGIPTLYKELGVDYANKIIQPAVQEVVKASTAHFTAEELITKRSNVKDAIDIALKERMVGRGIILETTSITNFDFSEEFNRAIEQKVTAQQTALKAENDLTRIKIEKEQAITQAEAQAQSTVLKADAEAYALKVINEQLQKSEKLVQYKSIERWNGVLPQYTMGGTIPFIQIPTGTTQVAAQ